MKVLTLLVKVLKWVGMLFAVLLLVAIFLPVFVVEIPFRLAFGWISFLRDNVAALEVNPLRVAEAIASIAALGVGGHHGGRWLYARMLPGAPWRAGWTAAGLGGVLLVFVAGVATIGITHQTAWLFTSDKPIVVSDWGTRGRVSEALLGASAHKSSIDEAFGRNGRIPESDDEAGITKRFTPTSYVKALSVGKNGVIRVEFAAEFVEGGWLTLTPAVQDGKLEWTCRSNLQDRDLPSECRGF